MVKISDDALLADLRKVATSLKHDTLSKGEYHTHGRYSPETMYQRFGSWAEALRCAGLGVPVARLSTRERHDKNELRDLAMVLHRLRPVMEELGRLPTATELEERGLSALARAIHNYHGGFARLRARLGQQQLLKADGFYLDFKHVLADLKPIREELGRLPTAQELREKRLHSLVHSIRVHHGGFPALRRRFGESQLKRPSGYYRSIENVMRALKSLITELGRIPTESELRTRRLSALAQAIHKYHGGLRALREQAGERVRKPDGYFRDRERVKAELQTVIVKLGHPPTRKELKVIGLGGLVIAAQRFHGGLSALIRELGHYVPIRQRVRTPRSRGYWRDRDRLIDELMPVIVQLQRFPTQKDLAKLGRNDLVVAIARHHCGFAAVRARMGYGPVTDEILKVHAESLVRVLLTLQRERQELPSDQFWGAIKGKWTEAQLKAALQAFEERQDFSMFRTLIQGG